MTLYRSLVVTLSFAWLAGCQQAQTTDSTPQPTPFVSPTFNQVNTNFTSAQVSCLLTQWSNKTYKNEPVVFRVINDSQAYASFFACGSTMTLPVIDFTTNSLLIGMKSDDTPLPAGPVIIQGVSQNLRSTGNGNYRLEVTVGGQSGATSLQNKGWFAFASLVPKINGQVELSVDYQFK